MTTYFIIVALAGCWCLPLTEGLIGYDCGSNQANVSAISLIGTEDCRDSNGTIDMTHIDGQIIQTQMYQPIHVHTCLVELILTTHYCGKLSHQFTSERPIQSYVKALGRSKCLETHMTGILNLYGHQIVNIKPNVTTSLSLTLSGETHSDGSCKNGGTFIYEDGTSVSNKVISSSVSITLRDRDETLQVKGDKIIIESLGLSCNKDLGYCGDSLAGEAAWVHITGNCQETSDVLYEGQIEIAHFLDSKRSKTTIATVETSTQVFALKIVGFSLLCGREIMETEHGRVKIVEKTKMGIYIYKKGDKYSKNIDLTYYVDSKFLYVTSNLIKRTDEMYNQFMTAMCQVRQQVLENRLILSQMRADQVGGLLERKRGVTASILGEVMYVTICEPVPVTFRKGEYCVQEFPITYNGEEKFLDPITHIIKSTGTRTLCSSHMAPAFLIDGHWHTYDGALRRAILEPTKLDPNVERQDWEFKSLLDISRGGLYDAEDMASLQQTMMFGSTREAVASNFAKVIYDQGKTGSGGLLDIMDDETMDGIGSKIGGFMWKMTSIMGDTVSFLFGAFVLFKLLAFLLDTCLNGTAIYKRMGWTLWILGAPLNAIVHLVMHGIVKPTQSQGSRSKSKLKKKKWSATAPEITWDNHDDQESSWAKESISGNDSPYKEASIQMNDMDVLEKEEEARKREAREIINHERRKI